MKKASPYIAVVVAMLIWAGSGIAVKAALESFAPLALDTSLINFRRSALASARAVRHNVGLNSFAMTDMIPNSSRDYHHVYINVVVPKRIFA